MVAGSVTVVARRRRFSEAEKQQYLVEAAATSLAAVARRYGIARSLLQRWKDKAGRSGFVELVAAPPASTREADPEAPPVSSVFVHAFGSVVVELPITLDVATLARFTAELARHA